MILCNASSGAWRNFRHSSGTFRGCLETLRKKVKKITIIEPDKVATWVDAHPLYGGPENAARAFGADVAILLEVEQLQSQSPGDLNMLQGDSKVHIQVFEVANPKNSRGRLIKEYSNEIYNGYAESTFPIRGPLPIDTGTSRNAFKHAFLKIVVKEISWHFVGHREQDSITRTSSEK